MNTKLTIFSILAVGAMVTFNVSNLAMADDEAVAAQVPQNLVSAESIDAQIQAQAAQEQDDANVAGDDSAAGDEALVRPGPGRGFRPVIVPRRDYRPYPVRYPYPRPYPLPLPFPGARLITCYAQSPANGVTYYGTAYYAAAAQNEALASCSTATGVGCVATGCN